MTRPVRVSGYRLILWWIATVCALAVACEIWPELDRVVTSLSDGALIAGTTLAVTYLGWVGCAEIREAFGRRRNVAGTRRHRSGPAVDDGQRGRVRR